MINKGKALPYSGMPTKNAEGMTGKITDSGKYHQWMLKPEENFHKRIFT